jgi:hypothetical protein
MLEYSKGGAIGREVRSAETQSKMKLHRFSATDYYRMGELGLLNERTELRFDLADKRSVCGLWHCRVLGHRRTS